MATLEERVVAILSSKLACHDAESLKYLVEYVETVFASKTPKSIQPYTSLDCFRRVIHIFALFPSYLKISTVHKILLSCLFNLPSQDFREILHLLPSSIQAHPLLSPLIFLEETLQAGHFKHAWDYLNDPSISDMLSKQDYTDKLRRFIIETLKLSYNSLSVQEFCSMTQLEFPSEELDSLLQQYKCSIETIQNDPENSVIRFNSLYLQALVASQFEVTQNMKFGSYNQTQTPLKGNQKHGQIDVLKDYYYMLKKQASQ